jgi:site-specific recombinase XerD
MRRSLSTCTGRLARVISTGRSRRRAIERYLEVRPASTDPHLLLNHKRRGLSDDGVQYALKEVARLAGVPGVSVHVLRHTFAHDMYEASGHNAAVVQRLWALVEPRSGPCGFRLGLGIGTMVS